MNQNSVILRVKNKSEVDQKYLFIALKTKMFSEYLVSTAQGSANQASVTLSDIFAYEIEWPNSDVRKSIVKIINTINQKIELNRQINQTLEQIAQAIFKSWFVDFEPTRAKIAAKQNGTDPERAAMTALSGKTLDELDQLSPATRQQLQETAALFPDTLVESNLGEIPAGWANGSLDDLCNLNAASWTKNNSPENVWYVDLANTKNGVIEEVQYYSWSEAPSRAKRVLNEGDTIIGTVRPGNRSYSFVGAKEEQLTASTGFAVLSPKEKNYTEYVYIAATSNENIDRLAHLADGGAYPAVRPDVVTQMTINIPSSSIFSVFSELIKPLFQKREHNLSEESVLTEIRDTLLPKLLSGELSVESAAEVAHV